MILPEVLLLFKTVLAILDFLSFHMKLKIMLSRSVKNYFGILVYMTLNLYLSFGWMAIFTDPLALEVFLSSESFFNILKILSYKSFTFF